VCFTVARLRLRRWLDASRNCRDSMCLPLAFAIARWGVDGRARANQSRRGAPAIRTKMPICDNWRSTAARLIRRLEGLRNGAQMTWSSPRMWHLHRQCQLSKDSSTDQANIPNYCQRPRVERRYCAAQSQGQPLQERENGVHSRGQYGG